MKKLLLALLSFCALLGILVVLFFAHYRSHAATLYRSLYQLHVPENRGNLVCVGNAESELQHLT